MNLRNPLATARGAGSAKAGTHHWWAQRMSSVLLVPLVAWFFFALFSLAGATHAEASAFLGNPVNMVVAIGLPATLFFHARLGLQGVLEDYVHTPWLEMSLQLLVKLFALAGTLLATLAVLKIGLGG